MTAAPKSLQSCPTLCDPMDGSPPGSPVPGILQPRTLEWGAIVAFILQMQACFKTRKIISIIHYITKEEIFSDSMNHYRDLT